MNKMRKGEKRTTIALSIQPVLKDALLAEARRMNLSVSRLVENIVRQHSDTHSTQKGTVCAREN